MVHMVTPTSTVVSTFVISDCSVVKMRDDARPPDRSASSNSSEASCLTFHGHRVVMAVSAPAKMAANKKSTAHSAVRNTSSVRLMRALASAAATLPPPLASATPPRRQTPAAHQTKAPATSVAMRCHFPPDQRAAAAAGWPGSAGATASRPGPTGEPRTPCGTHRAAHMGVAARLARPRAGATLTAVRPCAPRADASNSASMASASAAAAWVRK